jgi:4-hydroxy-tetrahydrodipicolinate synthase
MIMKTIQFTGVCTALVTPFLNNEVNYPMMEQLLRRQMEAGIPACVIAGTTGESPVLSDSEKLELFQRCKAYVGNAMQIIAGTGSNSTDHAVWLSREAEKCGVDGLLVVSPYYNKATKDGLVRHYRTIANAVSIPVLLYNVPSRTGLDILVEVYRELSEVPNIIGVKEAVTDIRKLIKIRQACGPEFQIWCGNDDLTSAMLALGARGVISVASNLLPETMQELCYAALTGDTARALEIQTALQPVLDALFDDVNPVPVKYAMQLAGFDCGTCRLPLGDASPETRKRLENVLKHYKLF